MTASPDTREPRRAQQRQPNLLLDTVTVSSPSELLDSPVGISPLIDDNDLYDSEVEQAEAEEEEGEGVTDAANEELAQEKVLKSGYLYKKGERRKSWKKRWFVLRNTKLAYYKDEKEYKLLHIINMKVAHAIDEVRLKNHPHALGIVTRARTYYMQAASRTELDEWLDTLWEVQARLLEERQSTAAEVSGPSAGGEPSLSAGDERAKRNSTDTGAPAAEVTQVQDTPTLPAALRQNPRRYDSPVSDRFQPQDVHGGGAAAGTGSTVRPPLRTQRSYHSASGVLDATSPDGPPFSPSMGQNDDTDSSDEEEFMPEDAAGCGFPLPAHQPSNLGNQAAIGDGAQSKNDDNFIVKSGYLWKRGAKYNGWKKRWFVLRNQKLAYYKNEKEYELKGMIPLSSVLDVLDCDLAKNRPHCFRVITPVRPFVCCAESAEFQSEWITALRSELAEVKNTISAVYDE